ncbi:MAG: dockerin type I repeat-containing protein, partial [Clostridia bacterium]|nr:dockerin type I repeat-containing protein [Clostridia bacterium]
MKNKFLCVFFAVTALLLCFVFSANASLGLTDDEILELEEVENYDECYSSGDADNNGKVESNDARCILRIAVNLDKIDTSGFMKADVDGDGKITAADAREALRLAVGLDNAPAHIIEEVVVVPATCSTDGLTVKVCATCMKIYAKVTLPATTDKHITGFWETVKEPDCAHKGLSQLKCLACGTVVKEAELSATNRHSGEWTYPGGKDCFNPVEKTRTCTVCGIVEEKVENPRGGHTFKWIAKVEKTCTEDGVQVNTCTHCGFEKEEAPLPATGHIFEYDSVIKEATCEETGLIAKKCVKCDYTENERATPALGHNYDNNRYKVTKEPSCSEEGTADVVCSNCGDAKVLVLDKIPHTLTDKWTETLAPTCTEEGEKAGTCRYCGSVTEKIPAKGHDAAEWTLVKPATCTEPGIMQGECKVCGDVTATKETEVIPHSFDETTVYWTSGIRCKENANGYYKCKDCDAKKEVVLLQIDSCTSKNFKKTEVVIEATCTTKATVIEICDYCKEPIEGTEKEQGEALGHDYTGCELTVVTPATCTTDGIGSCACVRCGEIKTEAIAALGHDFSGEWVTVTPATCVTDGLKESKCSRCDEKLTEVIEASGHDFTAGEWVTTTPATCTDAGIRELKCSHCDATIKDSIAALGHDFSGEWVTTTPATCTTDGLKELGCTRCDETQKEAIPALGHDFTGEWVTTTPATCTTDGLKELGCTRCDETQKEAIPALGHDFTGEWV